MASKPADPRKCEGRERDMLLLPLPIFVVLRLLMHGPGEVVKRVHLRDTGDLG
jgi:hypothetical protein